MEILFLGTSEAHGEPVLLCNCKFCKDNQSHFRTSIIVKCLAGNVLFETPPEINQLLLNSNISNVKHIFISHDHFDHLFGIPEFSIVESKNIIVHVGEETYKYIQKFFPWINLNFQVFSNLQNISLGELSVTPIRHAHGDSYCYGFLLKEKGKKIFFLSDTSESPKLKELVDVYILDGQYITGKPFRDDYHWDKKEILEFLRKQKNSLIYLVGINSHYLKRFREEISQSLPKNVKIAQERKTITL